ncbi:MAG: outer membrane protein assembly factor BamA [Gammaproteobacteria bacterium]|nr:MAG: outer membrane protein assembly factor BamA [Gammaproteobacteria bacterium]RKZ70409.1 MAG: outer membrane protein assembly factor BamA [Gammaproteobacteria bacterium]
MQKLSYKLLYVVFFYLFMQMNVFAVQEFVIEDIRVEGLQRITPGTVFNYLPMKVGDTFDDSRSSEAVRALFKTGFFEDVRLERDGGILVFILVERPAIGSITLIGNEDIRSEDLIDSLRQIGFAEGRAFDRSQLEKLEQELTRQYNSLGKYAVRLTSTVTELDNNRVAVTIEVSEGVAATIQKVNIVGNTIYKEKKLLKKFNLRTTSFMSFYTKNDQYSRQKLSADLETLRSYYLNNGYINFNIDSTQVSITPDKKGVYITINISEGELFTVSEVKLTGNLIFPETMLAELISVRQGDIFSRRDLTNSSDALSAQLGNEGYAFANVNSIPEINDEEHTVAVTFFVDPGKRAYVRRITFSGNSRTRDEILRREMRQQEGSWIATEKVDRGRVRLQRLGFFGEVNVETPAVAGTTDQVDVHYSVEEKPSGNFSMGLGFSQTGGLTFSTSIAQDNFLGSGKRMSFTFNNSDVNRRYAFSYSNPYYTIDGVGRSLEAFFQETDSADANVTAFDNKIWGGVIGFGIPITEYNTFFTSLGYENTEISTGSDTADEVLDFILVHGNQYNILKWSNTLSFDTRNRTILPDKGALHRLTAVLALPTLGNSLEYYKVGYKTQWFTSLFEDYVFSLKGDIAYGDSYGDTEGGLPFFESYYAGGPKSVRGYEENTLGPVDSFGNPIGGNLRLVSGAEVILPVPFFKDIDSIRISGFFDAGNVWGNNEDFDAGDIRYSAGLSAIWLSPFGLVSASVAQPFNEKSDDSFENGRFVPADQIQNFQFTFGTSF